MDGDNGQSPMVVIPVPPPPPTPEPKLLVPLNHKRKHGGGGHGGGHGNDTGPPLILIAVIAAIVLILLAAAALGFGLAPVGWGARGVVAACPRPPMPGETQQQFNEQQREIRELRRQAFRGDFFAQLELGHRYEGVRPNDKNLQDPIEAATWYSLALANPDGFQRTYARSFDSGFFGRQRVATLYDDCRHGEREAAYRSLNRLLAAMSTEERDKVRRRATYVLSTAGSDGFRTLGRLHDTAFGPFGEPADDIQALYARRPVGWPDAVRLFERNSVDAYMYDYLAMQLGDQGAYVLLQDLQRTAPYQGYADIAEQRARRWVPPYEFYPPDAPESGVPHSDESEPMGEYDRIALYRIHELPFKHIADALVYLHVIAKPCNFERELAAHDVKTFQAMLGRPTTGWLSPLEKVRAVQFAAVNGSPKSQLVLAVMYAQGVGVNPDFARAFHWFEEADRQGSAEAKFAVATFFSEGLAGVADQEKAEAVVHQLDAALAGFKPSAHRLRRMLERVSPGPHRAWYGYGRPEEEFAPEDGYGYGPSPGPGGPYGGPGGVPPAQPDDEDDDDFAPGGRAGPGPGPGVPPPPARSPGPPREPPHAAASPPRAASMLGKTLGGGRPQVPAPLAPSVQSKERGPR